jgi:hypothetical protein
MSKWITILLLLYTIFPYLLIKRILSYSRGLCNDSAYGRSRTYALRTKPVTLACLTPIGGITKNEKKPY